MIGVGEELGDVWKEKVEEKLLEKIKQSESKWEEK